MTNIISKVDPSSPEIRGSIHSCRRVRCTFISTNRIDSERCSAISTASSKICTIRYNLRIPCSTEDYVLLRRYSKNLGRDSGDTSTLIGRNKAPQSTLAKVKRSFLVRCTGYGRHRRSVFVLYRHQRCFTIMAPEIYVRASSKKKKALVLMFQPTRTPFQRFSQRSSSARHSESRSARYRGSFHRKCGFQSPHWQPRSHAANTFQSTPALLSQ